MLADGPNQHPTQNPVGLFIIIQKPCAGLDTLHAMVGRDLEIWPAPFTPIQGVLAEVRLATVFTSSLTRPAMQYIPDRPDSDRESARSTATARLPGRRQLAHGEAEMIPPAKDPCKRCPDPSEMPTKVQFVLACAAIP